MGRWRYRRGLTGRGLPPFLFDMSQVTFTAGMAVRTGPSGIFAGAPIVQGDLDGSGVPDVLSYSRGTQVNGNWYDNFDPYQFTIAFLITPEWDGDDGISHYIFYSGGVNDILILKSGGNKLRVYCGGQNLNTVDISTWTAGTTYSVVVSGDVTNTIDGTNYIRISVDDAHTYGVSSQPTATEPSANILIGSNVGSVDGADVVIENLTVLRRVVYDGTYGIDVGNGDEIANFHNSGTFADMSEVTNGAWDCTFSLPTNATPGALSTGTGHAWSMPHRTGNLLGVNYGYMLDNFGPDQGWCVAYNGTTTSTVVSDGAAIQDLQDAAFTVEAWVRIDGWGELGGGRIADKSADSTTGWYFHVSETHKLVGNVECATTNATTTLATANLSTDGKWHHLTMFFDDAGDRKCHIALDGVWQDVSGETVGVGAIVTDVGDDLFLGSRLSPNRTFDGAFGWVRISDNDRYNGTGEVDFTPARTMPASDGNTVVLYNFIEGTGTTIDNAEGTAAYDGTLSNGTWERKWEYMGAPTTVAALATTEGYYANQGFKVTTTGANIGIKKAFDVTAGDDFVQRIQGYSDGTSVPKAILYDVSNAAEIGSLTSDVADRVTNGTFAADSDWAKGTGWTIAAGVASCSGAQPGNSSLAQYEADQANGGIEANVTYNTSFDITNYGAGSVRLKLGATSGTARSANGTHTETLVHTLAGENITFIADVDFIGDIDNVIITRTATRAHPDVFLFTGEAPAGCTVAEVQLTNTDATASDITYWAQAEVYDNLIDNPSMETGAGDPWIPTGWANSGLDAGDSLSSAGSGAIIHSGADCIEFATGAVNGERIYSGTLGLSSGDYVSVGYWSYGDGGVGVRLRESGDDNAALQRNADDGGSTLPGANTTTAWVHNGVVWRSDSEASIARVTLRPADSASDVRYADDIYVIALTAVSLTATPASTTNSAEGTGIRVDGGDTLSQPIPSANFTATAGEARWSWTPRHDAADVAKFGNAATYIAQFNYDGSNRFLLYFTGANSLRLYGIIGGVAGNTTIDATGLFVAGTKYQMRLVYNSTDARLYVDGVLRITHTPAGGINFGSSVPNTAYWGHRTTFLNSQGDAVLSPY